MNRIYLSMVALAAATTLKAATAYPTDLPITFDPLAIGTSYPVLWGLDTAWASEENMLRSVRYMTPEVVGSARVSYNPFVAITTPGVLPDTLMTFLNNRMRLVGLIGHKVDICINQDGGDRTDWDTYKNNAKAYCDVFDATAAAIQNMGYTVSSVAPFNEPDLGGNNCSMTEFAKIVRMLKSDSAARLFPHLQGVRISGPNTLNPDFAMTWYNTLKRFIDEGNTHQLAGLFNNYANFFTTVRADGKYATADELHNIMECMVGSEYGMQQGIWWGAAELTRGMFCQATSGQRLAYAENRPAWSSASVYRHPKGQLLAFVGQSERQGWPCTYHFLTPDHSVYYNGQGPVREFPVWMPGEVDAYQSAAMKNAECFFTVGFGEDIQPEIDGEYAIVNRASGLAISAQSGATSDFTPMEVNTYAQLPTQQWRVIPAPHDIGLDFSYWLITLASDNGRAMDLLNYNLNPGAEFIMYGSTRGGNQQWGLEYAGNNLFRLRNRHSALYLQTVDGSTAAGARLTQAERSDDPSQLWRLMPLDVAPEFEAPQAPSALQAQALPAAVALSWTPSASTDVAGYDILRISTTADGTSHINTVARDIAACRYVDCTIVPGNSYTYQVRATDRCGNRSAAVSNSATVVVVDTPCQLASYAFNGTADDSSVNGFAPVSANGAQYAEGPEDGLQALRLDGTNAVQLPYTLMQRPQTTVAMWVAADGANDNQVAFATGSGQKATGISLEYTAAGAPQLVVNGATVVGQPLAAQTWHHLAATIDGSTATLYVDGTAIGSTTVEAYDPRQMLLTYVGRSHDFNSPQSFCGKVADLQVYNYALTPSEVSALAAHAGIENVEADGTNIVATEYYNLQGQRLSQPQTGTVTLRRDILTDGSSRTTKLRR